MEVRGFRDGDRGALARLGSLAFGDQALYWERYFEAGKNPRLDPDRVYVVEEDGEARASATVLPLEVFVDGSPAPMGGVSAVMAHPAYRRRGYAGELVRAVLAEMREKGTHLSMLWPFAHAFYRAYGWELAGEAVEYTLKPTDLPTSPEQRRVRAYREEDLPRLMDLLDGEAAGQALCVRRDERTWLGRALGGEGNEAAVYERDGRVEGYAIYRMSPAREDREPHRLLSVRELVAGTRPAREALLSFVAAHDPLEFEVKYSTPRGEPLHPYLRNSYVKAEVSPEFMLRLVDVEGALKLLDLPERDAGTPLTLEVTDDVIPENTGTYTVAGGEVARDTEADARVALDVRALAQLYAGYLPARGLARHGLAEPSLPEALRLLEELFPPGDPWVFPPDHF